MIVFNCKLKKFNFSVIVFIFSGELSMFDNDEIKLTFDGDNIYSASV